MSEYLLTKFIKMSQSLDVNDKDGNTMLHHLSGGGNTKITKVFLEKALKNGELDDIINEYNGRKQTPLQISKNNRDKKMSQLLINYGANCKLCKSPTNKQKGGGGLNSIIYGKRKI